MVFKMLFLDLWCLWLRFDLVCLLAACAAHLSDALCFVSDEDITALRTAFFFSFRFFKFYFFIKHIKIIALFGPNC